MARIASILLPLPDTAADSQSPARAEVIRSLAGASAYLHELATGAFEGDTPCTPPNPQGEVGVDLSGPPWGSAFWHPIATCGGIARATGQWYGNRNVCAPFNDTPALVIPYWNFWVRPHADLPQDRAPYSRAYLRCRAYRGASNTTLTAEVTCHSVPLQPTITASVSITSNTEASYQLSDNAIPLVSGWNRLSLRLYGTTAGINITLCSLQLGNEVKRRH